MQDSLIFDLGMHLAQDTGFYLKLGYRVVAVDASPEMISKAREKFHHEVENGRLQLLNYAMSDVDGREVEFHLSEKSEWNSLDSRISERQGRQSEVIRVATAKLSSLISRFGVPFYCKIDVEGFDHICIKTLAEVREIPRYISCETECFSENQSVTEDSILATLNGLREVGYKKFKLVDQETLSPLYPDVPFYSNARHDSVYVRGLNRLLKAVNLRIREITWRERLSEANNYSFPFGSTGPFGENAPGKWMSYASARDCLLFHREAFFKQKVNYPLYTIWCDWHATY